MFSPIPPVLSEDEYIFDDKRKIIINQKHMTPFQFHLYKRNAYKRLRPDLTNYDFIIWKEKYRMGEYYLNEMRRKLNNEVLRFSFMGHRALYKQDNKYFEDQLLQLSTPHIKGPGFHVERTWEEASKIVGYITKLSNRIQRYYLEYPKARFNISSDQAKQLEDELTDRLVREMRKPPVQKNQESEE